MLGKLTTDVLNFSLWCTSNFFNQYGVPQSQKKQLLGYNYIPSVVLTSSTFVEGLQPTMKLGYNEQIFQSQIISLLYMYKSTRL